MDVHIFFFFFFSSRRRHTRYIGDWSSDVCSSDLALLRGDEARVDGLAADVHDRAVTARSEERRVGKERRSRWAPYHYKKKKEKQQKQDRQQQKARKHTQRRQILQK